MKVYLWPWGLGGVTPRVLLAVPLLLLLTVPAPAAGSTVLLQAGHGELYSSHDGFHLTVDYVVTPVILADPLQGYYNFDFACSIVQSMHPSTHISCFVEVPNPKPGWSYPGFSIVVPGPAAAVRGRGPVSPEFPLDEIRVCVELVGVAVARTCATRVV